MNNSQLAYHNQTHKNKALIINKQQYLIRISFSVPNKKPFHFGRVFYHFDKIDSQLRRRDGQTLLPLSYH